MTESQFMEAWSACYRTVTAFSVSECDPSDRQDAMQAMGDVRDAILLGVGKRERERKIEEERRIIAAWREGRLKEVELA